MSLHNELGVMASVVTSVMDSDSSNLVTTDSGVMDSVESISVVTDSCYGSVYYTEEIIAYVQISETQIDSSKLIFLL